jgi:hypothetical protein
MNNWNNFIKGLKSILAEHSQQVQNGWLSKLGYCKKLHRDVRTRQKVAPYSFPISA